MTFQGYGRWPVFLALLILGLHFLIPALISSLWLGIICLVAAVAVLIGW